MECQRDSARIEPLPSPANLAQTWQADRRWQRGCARRFVRSQGLWGCRGRELCPQLTFVSGHFKDYQRLGDAAIKVLCDFAPLVERILIDEAFADAAGCTHFFGPPAGNCYNASPARADGAGHPILC
jgi:nucleotidyltransferase/DNA polymerase involved in DNA repair